MLRECRDMLGFLFVSDAELTIDDKAVAKLKASAGDVLDAGIHALEGLGPEQWGRASWRRPSAPPSSRDRACPTVKGSNRVWPTARCAWL